MEKNLYYKYSSYLRETYGEKVYKLPVNLPVSCPNRDGTTGTGGCIFCGEKSAGYEAFGADTDVREQIVGNRQYIAEHYHANLYEVYFQTFTNTYMELPRFAAYVEEALTSVPNIVMLTISTRPDCVARQYLDILRDAQEKYGVAVTLELGLQSVNANTLRLLKRGHTLVDYIQAVQLVKSYGFHVCTHIISTLPWDADEDVIDAARLISTLCGRDDSVKLHSLYIEKNTVLEKMYRAKEFELLSLDAYIKRTVDFIEHLRPEISFQRLNARVPKDVSTFANWGRSHWILTDKIVDELERRGSSQGCKWSKEGASAVRKFTGGDQHEF